MKIRATLKNCADALCADSQPVHKSMGGIGVCTSDTIVLSSQESSYTMQNSLGHSLAHLENFNLFIFRLKPDAPLQCSCLI